MFHARDGAAKYVYKHTGIMCVMKVGKYLSGQVSYVIPIFQYSTLLANRNMLVGDSIQCFNKVTVTTVASSAGTVLNNKAVGISDVNTPCSYDRTMIHYHHVSYNEGPRAL